MAKAIKETDLYPPVKRFLEKQGFEVKAEVGRCDVMAVRGSEPLVIVELKTGFTMSLVYQAIDRLALTDHVYVAFPLPARGISSDEMKLCRRLGLGLLAVRDGWVEPYLDPVPYVPRKQKARAGRLLKEFHNRVSDANVGGSTRRPLMTAYRQDALRCASYLDSNGPARVCDVAAATKVERAAAIFRSNVYGWFEKVERGVYVATASGRQALSDHREVIAVLTPA
jgi:hypothetical protein